MLMNVMYELLNPQRIRAAKALAKTVDGAASVQASINLYVCAKMASAEKRVRLTHVSTIGTSHDIIKTSRTIDW